MMGIVFVCVYFLIILIGCCVEEGSGEGGRCIGKPAIPRKV